jgi:DNA invertase Pin-like site-specific DNA recombinase
MVYVRQSTVQQTVRHQESTRLQYGLVERAAQLGWPQGRVVVIDDDQGRSGSSAEGRPGFQRLVAEVGLDHVGVILGVEMSRLARSCRDWHQLLEVCAIFGTLICDLDGLYDPAQYNDRLLLGLKGTMSEAELHVLKQRMLQGKMAKARRGELGMRLPIGYLCRPSGEVVQDPDEQVQAVVRLVFEQFEARGTINGVLRYLVQHRIRMPVRSPTGENKGELEWHRPNRITLSNLLHNPTYAGAYVYGRRPTDPRRKQAGRPATGRTVAPMEDWEVLLKDRHPAYISWAQYEENLRQLSANRARALGVARKGPALLSGLLHCGRCGMRMAVSYGGKGGYHRYACSRRAMNYGEPLCQSLAGRVLDDKVAHLVLRALMPSALEVSLRVAEDIEAERNRLEEMWQKRMERAQYEVDRALRQYNAVEPENRLVARTLEKQLEEKLSAQNDLKVEHDRVIAQQPVGLTAEERQAIRALASDIPALWKAPTTKSEDRQTIIRQLIDRIVVKVQGQSERVDMEIHWAGGHRTTTELNRPVARLDQLSYYPSLVKRILGLQTKEVTLEEIAECLNEEGWRPPKRRMTFNASMVGDILSQQRGWSPLERRRSGTKSGLRPHEWLLPELAAELSMPSVTLYFWLRRGWIQGRRLDEPRRPWVLHADAKQLAHLRALRQAPKRGWHAQTTRELAKA